MLPHILSYMKTKNGNITTWHSVCSKAKQRYQHLTTWHNSNHVYE
jgi:hypothetical protein